MEIKEKKDLERYALYGPTLYLHFLTLLLRLHPIFLSETGCALGLLLLTNHKIFTTSPSSSPFRLNIVKNF